MKNIITTIILSFFLFSSIIAQHKVTGIAQDAENNPLEFANVMLLSPTDSSLVALEMTEADGSFEMKDIEKGSYLLQISSMGYDDHTSEEITIEGDLDLGITNISKSDIELSAVEVRYKKPLLEQKGGTLIVNVANSIIANSGSAESVLKRVPGVMIINGKITMAGRTGVNIMIDGRPTQYMDLESLLKDLPSDAIERIEVMSQPDARFDAQGDSGIINIILKKNIKLGMNGSAYVGAGYGDVWRFRAGTSLNYRNEKFNFSNNLSFNRNSSVDYMKIVRNVNDDVYTQNSEDPYKPLGLYLKSGLDYYLSEKHTIGTGLTLFGGINDKTDNNTTTIDFGDETLPVVLINTTNDLYRTTGFISTDSYYQFDIDTSGQKLSVDLGYFKYTRQADNDIMSISEEGFDERRKQSKPSESDIWAVKADYAKPIMKDMKIETGIKYSYSKVDNDLQSSILQNGVYVPDANLSNHFIYTENLKAAYLKWSYSIKKMSFEAGVRFEDTQASGYSVTLDSTTNNNTRRFFPSMSISGPFSKKLGWVTAYSHRINRANFGELNPFVYYIDPFTSERGNPFLKPELTHSVKLSLTYEKQPFFNLEYRKTTNEIQLLTEQDNETGIAAGYSDNLNNFERFGTSLFFPTEFVKGMSGYGGVMVNYDRYITDGRYEEFNQSVWNATAFLNINHEITKNFSAEINGWYTSRSIEGVMIAKPLYGIDAGLQFKFLDEKARLNLSVDNILYKPWRADIQYNDLDAYVQSDWEHPVVNLRFSYRFGNKHLKNKNNRRDSTSDEKNRNN